MPPESRFRDRRGRSRAVALFPLFLVLAGCTDEPPAETRDAPVAIAPPPHAVDRWELHQEFVGSGVYVAKAEVYPLQDHNDYEAEILAMVYSNQRSSFVAAELSVFNRTENRDSGGGGANFQPARRHVGLDVSVNGQTLVGPLWVVDDPLGFDGGGGRSSGPITGPKRDEKQTLMLVVAYATAPDDKHPFPATLDLVVTSPERNLVPLDATHTTGGTGAVSYLSGELHGTEGIGIVTGETSIGVESNISFGFSTRNDTLVHWYAYAPPSPGPEGLGAASVPTGQLDLTVSNESGSRNFSLGLDRPHWDVFHDYFQHGAERWEFNLDVRGRADIFVAYADAPLASTWNVLVCDGGGQPC